MAETGVPMEAQKISLGQKLREAFTPGGAKEKWFREHADVVKKYTDVNNGLTEEQRAQAMQTLEDRAGKSATIDMAKHYGAVALVAGSAALGGKIIFDKNFQATLMKKEGSFLWKVGNWGVNRKAQLGDIGLKAVAAKEDAIDFVKGLPARITAFKDKLLKRTPVTVAAT